MELLTTLFNATKSAFTFTTNSAVVATGVVNRLACEVSIATHQAFGDTREEAEDIVNTVNYVAQDVTHSTVKKMRDAIPTKVNPKGCTSLSMI